MDLQRLCMGCMHQTGQQEVCPYCGFVAKTPQIPPYLPLRTLVDARYVVGRVLDSAPDGTTYVGYDLMEGNPVYIREFLPESIAYRREGSHHLAVMKGCELAYASCMQDFLILWRGLAKLRNLGAIFPIYDIVEENGTAYCISEYVEYATLRDYLLNANAGRLTWDRGRSLFMPALSALGTLHYSGILHLGLSPNNLVIDHSGRLRITGFSITAARQANGDLPSKLEDGYAAFEQYGFTEQIGPWTDIYSFAAVIYRTLAGASPVAATKRVTNDQLMMPAKIAESLPVYVTEALTNALQVLPGERTRNTESFRAEISASPAVTQNSGRSLASRKSAPPPSAPVVKKPKPTGAPKKKKNTARTRNIIVAICAMVVILAVVSVLLLQLLLPGGIFIDASSANASSLSAETIKVPNLVNQQYNAIKADATLLSQFNVQLETEDYHDTVPAGAVFYQSPPAGAVVNQGTIIKIRVSKGPRMIELPYVTGQSLEFVKGYLEDLGFRCEVHYTANDGAHAAGTVAGVDLTEGQKYAPNTTVSLQVWE